MDGDNLQDYMQALAATLDLPGEGGMGMHPSSNLGSAVCNQGIYPSNQAFHSSPHLSPRADFNGNGVQSTAHSAGNSGAISNHSAGAYNSGASGGQPSAVSYNFFENPGAHSYPAEVPQTSNPHLARSILDDMWPASNSKLVTSKPRPLSGESGNMQSVFNVSNIQGSHINHLNGAISNPQRALNTFPPFGHNSAERASGFSLSSTDVTYPLSAPHSETQGNMTHRSDGIQSIVSLNSLGIKQEQPASWDGITGHMNSLSPGEGSGSHGNPFNGGYLTPRSVPATRASSAPLAHQGSPRERNASGANPLRPKRRRRNEQQQVNNKLAQQRYREKQKQKTRELEGQVEELTAQVKALETSNGRSRDLMQENEALRTEQQQLRALVSKLQGCVKKFTSGGDMLDMGFDKLVSSPNSAVKDLEAARALGGTHSPRSGYEDVDMDDRNGSAVAGDAASSGGNGSSTVLNRLASFMDRIRQIMDQQGLPHDYVIPDESRYSDMALKREMASLIQSNSSICSKLLVSKGSEMSSIIQTDVSAACDLWGRCLVGMNLGDQQVLQILESRTKVLQRLASLSEVRNHLALRTVGILLPNSRQRSSSHPSHEARLQSLEKNGAADVMCKEQELQDALDEVSGNLRAGRCVIAEFNQFFITKVLKVQQAAVLLSIAHPYHPDCLAMANLLAQTRRNVISGGGQ